MFIEQKQCVLCAQINHSQEDDLLYKLTKEDDYYSPRIVYESENFIAFPSIGPLVLGHVIVCPKFHTHSFACLDQKYNDEYCEFKASLTRKLINSFLKPVHVFEHGMSADCKRILCSITHAHQHFIPTEVDISHDFHPAIKWEKIPDKISGLYITKGEEYFLFHSYAKEPIITISDISFIQSQYIRKLYATALGERDKWNWRDYPSSDLIRKTYKMLTMI